ncbi:MAG: hypothetical protein L6275_00540 [Candidatus Portnoybacteria bacterium]|nr:hypothetical protein [Candidatus Portnoybacteria bacterium]
MNNSTYEYQLSIKQKGHLIEGRLFIKSIHLTNECQSSVYNFNGMVTEGFLSIQYSSANKKAIGLGSLLLKITNQGNSLEGGMVYMEINTTRIDTDNDITLNRKNK